MIIQLVNRILFVCFFIIVSTACIAATPLKAKLYEEPLIDTQSMGKLAQTNESISVDNVAENWQTK